MRDTQSLKTIPDDELLRRLAEILHESRRVEADLLAHVAEVDARRLYAREACPSMFVYCTERLHLSEAEAYLRIAAARASREHPVLLAMLADGRLHLSGIAKLAPHLTPENRDAVLERAAHRSKRGIEELVAELAPRPDAPAGMRKLPERRTGTVPALSNPLDPPATDRLLRADGVPPLLELRPDAVAPVDSRPCDIGLARSEPGPGTVGRLAPSALTPRATVEPLAPARYRVQFTASAELRDKLERLRALMRSSVPDGDLATLIEEAVTEKLERLEARRFAKTKAPRKTLAGSDTSPKTRRIPAAVRRAVYERDGGRCRYVDEQGRRCPAREGLEYHHRRPFGFGGDHSVKGISLLCKRHNALMAEVDFGRASMARHGRPRPPVSEATRAPSP